MTRFRIVPYGADRWKVQDRWLFLWLDCMALIGSYEYARITFATEAEAEQWIDAHHKKERDYDAARRETARRHGRFIPREYPEKGAP